MIWSQAAVSFLVWLGYGLVLRKRSERLRVLMRHTPRKTRVLLGSVGILGSAVLLFAALYGLGSAGAISGGTLTLWAWPLVTLAGCLFVHMQVLGAAAMITLVQESETARVRAASDRQEPNSPQSTERPE